MYTNQRQNQDTKELRRLGGRWLKERRESAGLSQRQLAEILGVEYYTFISQIETGHGRIPPDRYEAWAGAIGLELADFVREILRYYDPVTFSILFGAPAQTAGSGPTRSTLVEDTRARDALASDNRQLQEQVRELQRLLGKKTMELEQVREKLAGAAGRQAAVASPDRHAAAFDIDAPARAPASRRNAADVAAVAGEAPPYGEAGD
ncbi:helix-turn-helix domain-containing protein [Pseudochelatococcus sp. B33]